MTGHRLPWSLRRIALAGVGAFAGGVQVRLLFRAGLGAYPPPGSEGLAWSTLLLLVGVLLVTASHLDLHGLLAEALQAAAEAGREAMASAGTALAQAGAETREAGSAGADLPPAADADPVPEAAVQVDVRLETPFDRAPVVAPGEDAPVRVHVDAPGLEGPTKVRLAARERSNRRVRTLEVDGSAARSVSFSQEGPVEVHADVDHRRAEASRTVASGRCLPYRDAVGETLDDLRDRAEALDVPAGSGSTPRKVCRALPAGPTDDLRDRLEAVLYGDEPVGREDYLEVHDLHQAVVAGLEEGSR